MLQRGQVEHVIDAGAGGNQRFPIPDIADAERQAPVRLFMYCSRVMSTSRGLLPS